MANRGIKSSTKATGNGHSYFTGVQCASHITGFNWVHRMKTDPVSVREGLQNRLMGNRGEVICNL